VVPDPALRGTLTGTVVRQSAIPCHPVPLLGDAARARHRGGTQGFKEL